MKGLTASVARPDGRAAKSKPRAELITGAAADAIKAQIAGLRRQPTQEQQVREILGLPPEWRWVIMKREGKHPDYWGTTLEGGICPPKTRGRHVGAPNWAKATLKRKFTLSDEQHDAWLRQWEAEEGRCHACQGTGYAWAAWHFERGTEYRACTRCGASGKPPLPPQPLPPQSPGDKARDDHNPKADGEQA